MTNSHADPWIFNYRADVGEFASEVEDSDHDKSQLTGESTLWAEVDISSRKDTAVFKKNPFSIAKINAFTRSAVTGQPAPVVVRAQASEKPSTVQDFFKKVQKGSVLRQNLIKPLSASVDLPPCVPTTETKITSTSTPLTPTVLTHPTHASLSVPNKTHPVHYIPTLEVGNHLPNAHTTMENSQSMQKPTPNGQSEPCTIPSGSPTYAPKLKKTQNPPTSAQKSPKNFLRPRGKLLPSATATKSSTVTTSPGHRNLDISCRAVQSLASGSFVSTQDRPKPQAATVPCCYEFGQNEDQMWSTLPPPKKKFKSSTSSAASKSRTSGPFRLPGLGSNVIGRKTGTSAISPSRVITFLPTPLLASKSKEKSDSKLEVKTQQSSSPMSSPNAKFSFDPDEDVNGFYPRSSSPPTSDPIAGGDDIEIHWEPCVAQQHYPDLRRKAKEV